MPVETFIHEPPVLFVSERDYRVETQSVQRSAAAGTETVMVIGLGTIVVIALIVIIILMLR